MHQTLDNLIDSVLSSIRDKNALTIKPTNLNWWVYFMDSEVDIWTHFIFNKTNPLTAHQTQYGDYDDAPHQWHYLQWVLLSLTLALQVDLVVNPSR